MDFVCSKGQGWFEFIHYVLGALKNRGNYL